MIRVCAARVLAPRQENREHDIRSETPVERNLFLFIQITRCRMRGKHDYHKSSRLLFTEPSILNPALGQRFFLPFSLRNFFPLTFGPHDSLESGVWYCLVGSTETLLNTDLNFFCLLSWCCSGLLVVFSSTARGGTFGTSILGSELATTFGVLSTKSPDLTIGRLLSPSK